MFIEVTQEDIMEGQPCNCRLCPVARAISRRTNLEVIVRSDFVRVDDKTYDLHLEASAFVRQFDRGFRVQPFSFYMPIPEPQMA